MIVILLRFFHSYCSEVLVKYKILITFELFICQGGSVDLFVVNSFGSAFQVRFHFFVVSFVNSNMNSYSRDAGDVCLPSNAILVKSMGHSFQSVAIIY